MIYPCKNCEDRHVGCHSTCKDYKRACKERDSEYAKEREKEDIVNNYLSDRSVKKRDYYIKKKKRDVYKGRGRR